MITKNTRKILLSLTGYTTILGAPGAGKSSLLESLGVPYRPEPTEDIETLGMQMARNEYSELVQFRLQELDSSPTENPWRDSDFYTSLGLFKSIGHMVNAVQNPPPGLITSDNLVYLDLPLEQTIQRIIKRNRKSSMMEIKYAPERFNAVYQVYLKHPARLKYRLRLDSGMNYQIVTMQRHRDSNAIN